MKPKYIIIAVFLILLLLVPIFLYYGGFLNDTTVKEGPSGLFVGVDMAYDNITQIKQEADKIRPYTNTIVIGSTGITFNMTKLNDVSQYLYDKGFYFMIYAHPINDPEQLALQRQWILNAKPRWGDQFLGLYAFDEIGGRQLDNASQTVVHYEDWAPIAKSNNWTEAADKFVNTAFVDLHHIIEDQMGGLQLPLVTSDYALYWFDYNVSYDVVFAEFVWDYSRTINVALNRGAANIKNRDWGVMITWKYREPPYLESKDDLYNDLVYAYEGGAKYILIFDANENYTQSTLQSYHLDALKNFWRYATDNPRPSDPPTDRVAYVLPKDYGYGFRGPNDTIWGLWNAADYNDSLRISTEVGSLIDTYQNRLDIIYDDGLEANNSYGYSQFIFWNGTVWTP
jgi:hypothetical protein